MSRVTALALTSILAAGACVTDTGEPDDLAPIGDDDDAIETTDRSAAVDDAEAIADRDLAIGATDAATLLCIIESDSFAAGNVYDSHTTEERSCVSHRIDLNLGYENYGGHWEQGWFPQFVGSYIGSSAYAAARAKCANSYIKVDRYEGPSFDNMTHVSTQKTYATSTGVYLGSNVYLLTSCEAVHTVSCGSSFGYDYLKYIVRPVVNGDPEAALDGATIQQEVHKGSNGC